MTRINPDKSARTPPARPPARRPHARPHSHARPRGNPPGAPVAWTRHMLPCGRGRECGRWAAGAVMGHYRHCVHCHAPPELPWRVGTGRDLVIVVVRSMLLCLFVYCCQWFNITLFLWLLFFVVYYGYCFVVVFFFFIFVIVFLFFFILAIVFFSCCVFIFLFFIQRRLLFAV